MISVLTAAVVLAGYLAGCRILGLVYGVNLAGYEQLFALLLIFGGIAALSTFFSVVLTIMRRQIIITVGYAVSMALCLLLIDRIVGRFGLPGAGYAYGMIMTVILAVFLGAYLFFILRAEKEKKHE